MLEVFSRVSPAVALIRFVTGFESTQGCCWSARVRAVFTACVATGGLTTATAKLTVAVAPGTKVRFSASVGGAVPATVAFAPTSVNFTSSNRT